MAYNGYLKPYVPLIQKMHAQGKTGKEIARKLYAAGARMGDRYDWKTREPYTPGRVSCVAAFEGLIRYILGGQHHTPSRIKRLQRSVDRLKSELRVAREKLADAKAAAKEQRKGKGK